MHHAIHSRGDAFTSDLIKAFSVDTWPRFNKNLESLSVKYGDITSDNSKEKISGDIFEVFVACIFTLSPIDNRWGVMDYKATSINEYGVDGFGVGIDGTVATVQIKYCNNPQTILSDDGGKFSRFVQASVTPWGEYKVSNPRNLIVVTSGLDLNHNTKENTNISTIKNIKNIRSLVDGNLSFWKASMDLIKKS